MTIRTFPLTGPINLSARLGHGSITVHCVDDLAEATVELSAPPGAEDFLERVVVELTGPTLSITAPRQGGIFDLFGDRWRGKSAVDVTVTVPTRTALKIATFTADITVRGRCAGADIATGTARVDIDDVDGDLRLRSGASRATVGRVGGSATVRTGAGDAQFGEVVGDLHSGCGSGLLTAAIVRGTVRWRSGSGEARLGAVYGDVDLASGSGPMSVGLPAGVPARLDLQTGSGAVRSDLPVGDRPAVTKGAITVRARTGSGDVHLFRAA